jgi:hypothetical protein
MPVFLTTQEVEIGRVVIQGQAKSSRDPILTSKLGIVAPPATQGNTNMRIRVQTSPGIKQDPI